MGILQFCKIQIKISLIILIVGFYLDPGAQGNKVWLMPGYENSNGILNVADNRVCFASRTCEG